MNKAFGLLTAAVFIALLLPALVQQGMFLDGVSYAAIARNMANGLGSFTKPYYTACLYPVFYEQPPLVLWLQSLLFRVFGDHFWVERLYSFSMAGLTAYGLVLNAGVFFKLEPREKENQVPLRWLPVLFWITMPMVIWGYQHNMLECTMSVFVQFAVYFAVKAGREGRQSLLLFSALLTALAVLCKGPVGLFPVAVPFLYGAIFSPLGRINAFGQSAWMGIIVLVLLVVFLKYTPGMPEYLDYYLHKQLFPTISGLREKQVSQPFHFLLDLAAQCAIPAVLLLVGYAKRGFKRITWPKPALFSLAIGLAGTLPLAITPKQSPHYLLPALPFFALGFAIICKAVWAPGIAFFKRKPILEAATGLLLVSTVLFSLSFWGKYRRDAALIQAVKTTMGHTGLHSTLSIPAPLAENWLIIAYFARLGNVSLDKNGQHDFYLMKAGDPMPEGYDFMLDPGAGFRLLKKNGLEPQIK